MLPRDWFSVGVRLLGCWIFYHAVGDLIIAVNWTLGVVPRSLTDKFDDMHAATMYNFSFVIGYFALATYFVFGAEHLTRWAFKEPNLLSDDDSQPDE